MPLCSSFCSKRQLYGCVLSCLQQSPSSLFPALILTAHSSLHVQENHHIFTRPSKNTSEQSACARSWCWDVGLSKPLYGEQIQPIFFFFCVQRRCEKINSKNKINRRRKTTVAMLLVDLRTVLINWDRRRNKRTVNEQSFKLRLQHPSRLSASLL